MTIKETALSNGAMVHLNKSPIEGNWIFFQKDGEAEPVATSPLDYRYTHGGELYREACQKFWEIFE